MIGPGGVRVAQACAGRFADKEEAIAASTSAAAQSATSSAKQRRSNARAPASQDFDKLLKGVPHYLRKGPVSPVCYLVFMTVFAGLMHVAPDVAAVPYVRLAAQ
jgi:hypothetical protein